MENILSILNQYPEMVYALCVTFLTWVIFKYIIYSKKKIIQLFVLVSSGILLGVIFYFLVEVKWPIMILAFLASVGFYEIIIKLIMRKLDIKYRNLNKNE